MPIVLRTVVGGLLALLGAGTLYLVAARGEALLVDLSALAGRIWCF